MIRKSIPINVARQLWAQSGGFCQKPDCNKPLFKECGNDVVTLANVAHIIGYGGNGPRSDHELAELIEKDGVDNLIMLCLECHKIVDDLENIYSVEDIQKWKRQHGVKISSLFSISQFTDEQALLREVNDILDENGSIFREYGPFSSIVINGDSGDGLLMWRRRCLDTIVPNNQRIIKIIEGNKRSFSYPWDVYREMLDYKIHVEAFQDNCLLDRKINDYKTFPLEFDHFIKTKLGIPVPALRKIADEEIEYRHGQIRTFIDRFLSDHDCINKLTELNKSTMLVGLHDGRTLKVFVTNTYYFTEYTLDRILEIDPAIDAILCSCPAGGYGNSVKNFCIENGIGLFMLGEFMGAIRMEGEDYLNYLTRAAREERINKIRRLVEKLRPVSGITGRFQA